MKKTINILVFWVMPLSLGIAIFFFLVLPNIISFRKLLLGFVVFTTILRIILLVVPVPNPPRWLKGFINPPEKWELFGYYLFLAVMFIFHLKGWVRFDVPF
jgi:hypothetical protein